MEGRLHPRHPEPPAAEGDSSPRRPAHHRRGEGKRVELDLQDGVSYTFQVSQASEIGADHFETGYFPFAYEEFFPKLPARQGDRELTMGELSQRVRELRAQGKPQHGVRARFEVEWHKKFAIPTACFVFGLLGLGLSLGSKKEARSAAFGLSIARHLHLLRDHPAGRAGRRHRPHAPARRGVGGQRRPGRGRRHSCSASTTARPRSILSTRRHYTALLPRIRHAQAERGGDGGAPGGRGRRPGPRRVVVLRVPRIGLPIPGLLDRYVVRTYLENYALVLTAFWAIYVLVSFMDLFDDVQQNKVKGAVVFHYYTFFSTAIVHLLTPVAVLVAVLITFGVMARHNEITAMKAAGLSVYRIVFPASDPLRPDLLRDVRGRGVPPAPPQQDAPTATINVIKGRPPSPRPSTSTAGSWAATAASTTTTTSSAAMR